MEETMVLIVGGGPSGLATSACLNLLSVPNIIVEREDCCGSLWKKKSYDRLKLHLAKQFCELPHMPYPPDAPTFVSKAGFIQYLDDYATHFGITPRYCRSVESANYDEGDGKWRVVAMNTLTNVGEIYVSKFMVVATGENSSGFVPKIPGIESFPGKYLHSTQYENGKKFNEKNVLVVGSGNSGMEIAYDLSNWGANTSIVARSPGHVLSKEMVFLGMCMLKLLPCKFVDTIILLFSKLRYGDFSAYGLQRPTKGPFYLKAETGRSPIIDVGTMDKIQKGEIQVFPTISNIKGNEIKFANGKANCFDALIFATGYRSTVRTWLKDGKDLFNDNGMPKKKFPHHWRGENGLYCAGFSSRGLFGISMDAQNIANDIMMILSKK